MLIIVPGICNSGHVAKQICDTQINSPPPPVSINHFYRVGNT